MENKTGKYFKYAIGEILLVVIGILMALSINNWREGRKNSANEAYVLNEILNNLNEDDGQIGIILGRRRAAQVAVEELLKIVHTKPLDKKGIEKNLALFLTFERFYPLNNAFEMMKSNGLIVENKNLRTSISRYYDFEQKKVAQSIKDIESVITRLLQTENFIRSNLKASITGTQEFTFVNIKNYSDSDFLELLHTELSLFKDNNGTSSVRVSDFKNRNNQLIKMIGKELENDRLNRFLNKTDN